MRTALIAACAIALAPSAQAQDAAADWDLHRDPDHHITSAYVLFDSGLAITFRCNGHAFEAAIIGLPPAPRGARTRVLRMARDDGPPGEITWLVGADPTMALNDYPAPLARATRAGGRMTLVVPGAAEGGRNLRYELTLPASSAAIDETLTACERPLVDPRDASLEDIPASGLTRSMTWARPPRGRYPYPPVYASGSAILTCLSRPDGSLGDCVVESEFPADGGFGEAALKSVPRAWVRNPDQPDQPAPVVQIGFRVMFLTE